jgi:hypothetical protein
VSVLAAVAAAGVALGALAGAANADTPAAEAPERAPSFWVAPEIGLVLTRGSAGASHSNLAPGLELDWWPHAIVGLRFKNAIGWFDEGTSDVSARRVGELATLLGVARWEALGSINLFAGAGVGVATVHVRRRALDDRSSSFEVAPSLGWTAGIELRVGRFLTRLSATGAHHRLSTDRVFALGFAIPIDG